MTDTEIFPSGCIYSQGFVSLYCYSIGPLFCPLGVELRRSLITVGLGIPDRGDGQHSDCREDKDHHIGHAPAVTIGHETESQTGDERTGIAEDTQNAVCACRGLFGRLVGGGDAQQGLRAIDKEGDHREGDGQQPGRSRIGNIPESNRREDGAQHAEDAGTMCAAAEDMVRSPSRDDHAEVAAHEFEDGHHDAGNGDRNAFRTGQKHHAPVEHRETDDIDEEVCRRKNPDDLVSEDHVPQESLVVGGIRRQGSLHRLFLLLFLFGVLVLQFGQADRRGGIAQREVEGSGAEQRDDGRDQEAQPPGAVVEIVYEESTEDKDQAGTDGVRHVPDGHLGSQFVGRHPMGHQRRYGRHAHSLEIAVEQQDGAHDDCQGRNVFAAAGSAGYEQGHLVAETEADVDQCAQRQTQSHEFPRTDTVGDEAVDKTRHAIDDPVESQEQAQLGFGDSERCFDTRHGRIEVLADEIVEGIADHRNNNGTGLPILEFFDLFECHFHLN